MSLAKQLLDLSGTAHLRQLESGLVAEPDVRYEGEVGRRRTGFAAIERLLVSGRLPEPEAGEGTGEWITEREWDFLIYLHSTASAVGPGQTFATWRAAVKKCGLFEDILRGEHGSNARKRGRREALMPSLERQGFVTPTEGAYQNKQHSLEWKQLMLAPTKPPYSPVPIPSGIPKTKRTLRDNKRSWFMMPEAIFNGGAWHRVGSHRGRRVIAALYYFFDEVTYDAVNPNHVRFFGDALEVSDEFMQACGQATRLEDVASTLSWLRYNRLFFPVAGRVPPGQHHPAGRHYVTWSRPVARNTPHDTVVFVPLYVPTTSEVRE